MFSQTRLYFSPANLLDRSYAFLNRISPQMRRKSHHWRCHPHQALAMERRRSWMPRIRWTPPAPARRPLCPARTPSLLSWSEVSGFFGTRATAALTFAMHVCGCDRDFVHLFLRQLQKVYQEHSAQRCLTLRRRRGGFPRLPSRSTSSRSAPGREYWDSWLPCCHQPNQYAKANITSVFFKCRAVFLFITRKLTVSS